MWLYKDTESRNITLRAKIKGIKTLCTEESRLFVPRESRLFVPRESRLFVPRESRLRLPSLAVY